MASAPLSTFTAPIESHLAAPVAALLEAVVESVPGSIPADLASFTPDRFVRPSLLWYVALDSGVALTAAMALSADLYAKVAEASPVPVPSRRAVQAMFAGTVVLHIIESKVAYSMAKRRGQDRSAVRWGVSALVVGFPTLLKLRKLPK